LYTQLKRVLKRNILRSRDIINISHYGRNAPKYAELIWVNPSHIKFILPHKSYFLDLICSGWVTTIKRFYTFRNLDDVDAIRSSYAHWVCGVPWQETADYISCLEIIRKGMRFKNCKSEEDLLHRFENLDRIFQETRRTMRLKTQKELNPKAFREEGGILVGIGENGEPLLIEGYHRVSIASILGLPSIPAQLGPVDKLAIDRLKGYRS
jgi:hypothetical protein